MTQNEENYVVHVHQSEDPPAIAYGLLTLAVVWIAVVVYAITF